ncbi:MAG: trehalose-6-phosphate synthase [Isosphaera sp.]|nr:trehalose-6-phosphate synthase [Isosphaera sp.]
MPKAKPGDHAAPSPPARSRGRLIVVANRLPVNRAGAGDWSRSPGGLVSALEPILARRRGVWVGWDGGTGRAPRPFVHQNLSIHPVALSARDVEQFYNGMSNRSLWPLYHDAIRTPEFHRRWWETYQDTNQRFARAAARVARRGDLVWVHDYHLQLVPRMLRELRPDLRIGFFLHIPFPPEELFAWLPWRTAVLKGLLGADVVAFQTQSSAQNFSRMARRYAGAEGTDARVETGPRAVRVRALPISIDFQEFDTLAADPKVVRAAKEIRQRLGGRRVLLSVDRLDYTKGIEHRLYMFEDLLDRGLIGVDDAVMVQIAVPSREVVPDYTQTRTQVEHSVGRINGAHAEPGRVAVHYFRRSLSRQDLAAYYLVADVMLVTPLRDGMNLVAKEYVATRRDLSGALVLSEFAGAARELRRALLVNPRDVDGFGAAVRQALSLPSEDARQRMAILRMNVRRHDVHDWARAFLEELEGS